MHGRMVSILPTELFSVETCRTFRLQQPNQKCLQTLTTVKSSSVLPYVLFVPQLKQKLREGRDFAISHRPRRWHLVGNQSCQTQGECWGNGANHAVLSAGQRPTDGPPVTVTTVLWPVLCQRLSLGGQDLALLSLHLTHPA